MNPLSAQWRDEAGKLREAANGLLADEYLPKLTADVRQQILAVTGKVLARVLEVQADSLDFLASASSMDAVMLKRRAFMERNDAVRRAAAKGSSTGDWSDFDKLAAEFSTPPKIDVGSGGPTG